VKIRAAFLLAITVSALASPMVTMAPAAARGFGGGGMRGGGGFGGFHGGGGFDRGGGGFDRGGGGFDRGAFGGGAYGGDHFGGGFNSYSGMHGDAGRFAGSDDMGIRNYGGITGGPAAAGHLPTDGGLAGFAGNRANIAHNPTNIDSNRLSAQGTSVRSSFNHDGFNHDNFTNVSVNHYGGYHGGYGGYGYHGYGWGGYPGGWYAPGWSPAAAWTFMGVSTLTSFLGMGMMGAAMSGGGNGGGNTTNNITYEGDNVYENGQPLGTSQQYYQQAQQLASVATAPQEFTAQPAVASAAENVGNDQSDGYGQTADSAPTTAPANYNDLNEKWQALGVFALAEPGQTDSNMLMQLAINQKGILRGNYANQLTNENSQIYGALDKKTQRISWTIGGNNSTVFDTRLSDLVKDDSQVLVHYGPDNTKNMALIRLPAPKDEAKPSQQAS